MEQISKGSLLAFNSTQSEKKFSIPKILGDSYCVTILKTVKEIPKSVVEIHHDTRIPISTLYRRVQFLHDLNLLKISGSINSDGKKYFLYKSQVKSIKIKFDDELGRPIKFSITKFHRIPPLVLNDIATEIISISQLSGEEIKN